MEKAEFDLIVAGAGPAGSACAIAAARRGARVLLLDKDRFPRHKVCGEFVSPESLQLLAWLAGDRFHSRPAIDRARIFSAGTQVSLPISPPARSIPRFDLDAALIETARRSGVSARENVNIRGVEAGEIFRVDCTKEILTARSVVNATGRWSQLTQRAPEKDRHKWIGLKAHFHEYHPAPSVDLYFFAGGYCGVQPVGNQTVNACAMVRADTARSLEEVFSLHPELWRRSRSWEPLFAPIAISPLYFRKPQTESGGMLLAGDAAAFIDPFAGDGISLALHSGVLAADSLAAFFHKEYSLAEAHNIYHAAYMKQFAPAFRNAARVRVMLSAPPSVRSMLVRLAALPPFARALVNRTRTKGTVATIVRQTSPVIPLSEINETDLHR